MRHKHEDFPVPAPSWNPGAAHSFYTTGEDLEEVLQNIATIPHYENTEDPDRFIKEQKEEDGDSPEYWDSIQIFKVTIERVQRPSVPGFQEGTGTGTLHGK